MSSRFVITPDSHLGSPKLDRRGFLQSASAALLITALHPEVALGSPWMADSRPLPNKPLITGLRLLTAAPLEEMKAFYHGLLGFPVLEHSTTELIVQGGETPVTFVKAPSGTGEPWYHVAFNIPENKIRSALEWQLKRSPVIPTPARQTDRDYPREIRRFSHWNSHALFFWDPAGNLLEYIARHDLANASPGPFTNDDILYVSEIGLVVDDQLTSARHLNRDLGLGVYPQNTENWWAMGDETGLLLCVPKRLWGENTDRPKRFAVFPTETTITGLPNSGAPKSDIPRKYTVPGYPYEVTVL